MTDDNELLLKRFFSEAAQQTISDDGFTDRVMQHLPSRINWFTRLWNVGCVLIFIVLFVLFDGAELLAVHFEVLLRTLSVETFNVNIIGLGSVLFGLLLVGVGETVSRA